MTNEEFAEYVLRESARIVAALDHKQYEDAAERAQQLHQVAADRPHLHSTNSEQEEVSTEQARRAEKST